MRDGYRRRGKRVLDASAGLALLFFASPIIAATALGVRLTLGSPVIFRQSRPGLNEKPFTLMKFRTMSNDRTKNGELKPDSERLSPFGIFLRSTSLDELPELWNVVRGDMSLVGPRPLLPEYLSCYTETERLRHSVRPGLTGPAQISGRNNLDWDARLAIDVEYARSVALLNDLKILIGTVPALVAMRGVSAATETVEGNLRTLRSTKPEEWNSR